MQLTLSHIMHLYACEAFIMGGGGNIFGGGGGWTHIHISTYGNDKEMLSVLEF
jgi:hypothetical protein